MLVARLRLLTACVAILLAIVVGGCDSVGLPTSVTPTIDDVPTPSHVPTAVPGPSTFSGTYMFDGRPDFIYFLSITQTGNEVAGFLNNVNPDGKGGTKATTLSLNGTTDSDVVTLYASSTGRVYTLSKTSAEDGSLGFVFSFPTDSGQIAAHEVTPASQYEFNSLLATWQAAMSDQEQVTQDILAKSKTLDEWINHIEQATGSFNDSIGSLQEILSPGINYGNFYTESSDIQGIRDELVTVKDKAAVKQMSCSDIESVDYYYGSMKYNYDELGKRRGEFAKEVSSLEASLSQVEAYITETQDAAQVLDEAIKNSAYPYGVEPFPGDELAPISSYQAAADAARNQLPDLKATDAANQTTADSLMAEGKSVLDGAKALVNCPP